jgi:short-subunit dehydrogenase
VVERAGSLDVWVNNAGVLFTGVIYEQEPEVHRRMLDVNAVGTFNGTIAAIERMRESGRGHVINVVSLAGLAAAPGVASYAASKHAAIAFTIGTLADLRRSGITGINVSAVCPDGVWTPMLFDKLDDPHDALSFSGVMLMPEQVAERIEGLLDKPKAVIAIPRWRGAFTRFFDRHPDLAVRLTPLLMRDARRRQARFTKKVEAGTWPPKGS